MDLAFQTVERASKAHPKPSCKNFSYGTAGFRGKASGLDCVMFRMGLLAVLRSKAKCGKAIGVVITASHNPVDDNGVKLVDPLGEMLEESWEKYATQLANAEAGELPAVLQEVITETGLDFASSASVAIARDTRPSGEELAKSLIDGIVALSGTYHDYGVLTTPQLHYMIRCRNTEEAYGKSTEQGYYEKLAKAFLQLRSMSGGQKKPKEIKLDGANGVGALKMKELLKCLGDSLPMTVYNDGSSGKLNEKCGADYVKLKQCAPDGMVINPGEKCVTFDGDADRVIYFYLDKEKKFHFVDGDKISTLITGYFKEKLDKAGIVLSRGLGIVQTAYANGSATTYVQERLGVPVACAKTGVKHVHHKAQDFDIGVYFEANGHGTVLFSDEALSQIREAHEKAEGGSEQHKVTKELLSMIDLINEAVGDAIADMLVCEAILYQKGWAIEDWDHTYKDLPNRQRKVTVKDRTVIQTADAERKVVAPVGLQEAIDKLVFEVKHGRSFVRPSGTEDIVRVYAEGDTQDNADALALAVSWKVFDMAGGIGERP